MMIAAGCAPASSAGEDEVGHQGRAPCGRQVYGPEARLRFDQRGDDPMLGQAIAQAEQVATGPGPSRLGTESPAQADGVREIEPAPGECDSRSRRAARASRRAPRGSHPPPWSGGPCPPVRNGSRRRARTVAGIAIGLETRRRLTFLRPRNGSRRGEQGRPSLFGGSLRSIAWTGRTTQSPHSRGTHIFDEITRIGKRSPG